MRVMFSYHPADPISDTAPLAQHTEYGTKSVQLLSPARVEPTLPADAVKLDFAMTAVSTRARARAEKSSFSSVNCVLLLVYQLMLALKREANACRMTPTKQTGRASPPGGTAFTSRSWSGSEVVRIQNLRDRVLTALMNEECVVQTLRSLLGSSTHARCLWLQGQPSGDRVTTYFCEAFRPPVLNGKNHVIMVSATCGECILW